MDKFLKEKNASDLIGLYTFYYNTAIWQKTNQPKCNASYVKKGLHWSDERFAKANRKLKALGLVENFKRKNKESGKIEGHYIKVKYIWRKTRLSETIGMEEPGGGLKEANASSTYSVNASSKNSKCLGINNSFNSEEKNTDIEDVLSFITSETRKEGVFLKINKERDCKIIGDFLDYLEKFKSYRKFGKEDVKKMIGHFIMHKEEFGGFISVPNAICVSVFDDWRRRDGHEVSRRLSAEVKN